MPAREGCVLILGRRSRISLLDPVVVVVSSAAGEVGEVRGAKPVGRREGRRGVRMLKDLGGVSILSP